MTRTTLDSTRIHPAIASEIGGNADFRHTVDEVATAIDQHAVVIVGMDHNPYPKKARKLLAKVVLHQEVYLRRVDRRGCINRRSELEPPRCVPQ